MKKIFVRFMQILIIIIIVVAIGIFLFMRQDTFGGLTEGDRLEIMKSKSNYKDGAFDNIEYTPALAEGVSYTEVMTGFLFGKKIRNHPAQPLPVVKTDLKNLPLDSNLYIWFGHSSYYIQIDGKKILVDPVFSKYASPVRGSVKAFDMSYDYRAADMPEIDILVITHDHWDHLDYDTFLKIKDRTKHIITGLGVGAHFEKWGFPAERITELYWGDSTTVDSLRFTSATARHFSGRTFKRNVTLWSSFVLEASHKKIYIGGDSGYGKHFKEIGQLYGPFDYAILENGQYNEMWKYIHMMPEEVLTAGADLGAKHIIPVHSSKFPLASHPWDEPLQRIHKAAAESSTPILTPRMGEVVSIDNPSSSIAWWEGLE